MDEKYITGNFYISSALAYGMCVSASFHAQHKSSVSSLLSTSAMSLCDDR